MSWLFGMNKDNGVPSLNLDIPGLPPQTESKGDEGGGGKGGSTTRPSFDSEALERAAKAAKELEKSGNYLDSFLSEFDIFLKTNNFLKTKSKTSNLISLC
jgi:hypothetical protein